MRKEFILCAAINYHGTIISGFRHADCYSLLKSLLPQISEEPERKDQGFLTSQNRFVDRKEAFQIAKEQKQIIHHLFDDVDDNLLTSEDLY